MTTLPAELQGCTLVDRTFDDDDIEAVAEHDEQLLTPVGSVRNRCIAKVAYGRRKAHRAARVLSEAQGEDVHAYECGDCGSWHVGHRPVAWSALQ